MNEAQSDGAWYPRSVNSGSLVQTKALESAPMSTPWMGPVSLGDVPSLPILDNETRYGAVVVEQLRLVDEGPNVEQGTGRGGLGDLGAAEDVDVGFCSLGCGFGRRQVGRDELEADTEAVLLADGVEVGLELAPVIRVVLDTDDDLGLVERHGVGVGVGAAEVLDPVHGHGRWAAGGVDVPAALLDGERSRRRPRRRDSSVRRPGASRRHARRPGRTEQPPACRW